MRLLRLVSLLGLCLGALAACSMNNLPRNMPLKAFNPHRADFTCKYEADAVPPIDPQAEAWLQEGLRVTSPTLWPDQRDYKKAAQLWQQAADRKHWKAMLNLADAYARGLGVPRDSERAVQIVEEAMKLGIPGAYDLMGTYHMEGRGVKQDASRAYAFWQLAADMGSPSAMAYLGRKFRGTYNNPPSVWANRTVALKMLECGVAQGNGKAAYELGVTTNGTDKSLGDDYARALKVLHEGVKFGSMESARRLFTAFDDGTAMVGNSKDPGRAGRYRVLTDALEHDPDLRFPNLDKILPLPPAPLPKWDGDEDTLIDAAKQVVPAPAMKPTAGSQRTGRAHIPQGYALPSKTQAPPVPDGKPTMAAGNYKELSAWIAANKGKINLGNAGIGSASHLCGLLYQTAMKTEMTPVPYKGTAPAITDLIGGQIDLLCDQTTNTSPQIEGKKVKAYAVTTPKRLTTPLLKDLPTLQEEGLKGFEVTIWHGFYAPKGTPPAIARKLNDALKVALKDPDFIKKQEALGAVVATDGRIEPEGHKKFVAAEIAKWSPIIKAAGVYAD